jgi:DNA-binding IclR family transcriptional regulator
MPRRRKNTAPSGGFRANLSHRARETGDRQFITALARGLAILRCFRASDRYLSNQEIARRTGLPRPTVTRLTYTLTRTGFLAYAEAREAYSLAVGSLAVGHAYLAALNVRSVAQPLMQAFADETRTTVALAQNDGTRMVVVEICHGNENYRMRLGVGERVPHKKTALGRAYLAALSPEKRAQFLASLGCELTEAERSALDTDITAAMRQFASHGFVASHGKWDPDTFAAGTPLVSSDGTTVMALSCSGPLFDMGRVRLLQEVAPGVVTLRDRIVAATQGVF